MIKENKDIRETTTINEIVDCIDTNVYGTGPLHLIEFYNKLPNNQLCDYLRTLAVPYLFHEFEKHVKSNEDPLLWFCNSLNKLKINVEILSNDKSAINILNACFENNGNLNFNEEVKKHTGQHYGNLFKEFDFFNYFNEAKELLKTRLDRNNIVIENLKELTILDQGCGGGRYTTAW